VKKNTQEYHASKALQLSFGLAITDPDEHRAQAASRQRRCLSCSSMFASTGPGNRICHTCRRTDAWSSPAEFPIHAAF
jgi:hypothetical protein